MITKKRPAGSPCVEQTMGPNHDSPGAFPRAAASRWGRAAARFNSLGPCHVRLRKSHPYNWIRHSARSGGRSRSGSAEATMSSPTLGRILEIILGEYTPKYTFRL